MALLQGSLTADQVKRRTRKRIGFLAVVSVLLLLSCKHDEDKGAELKKAALAATPATSGTQWTGKRIRWTAYSHTASAITGDVETSPGGITMANNTYPLVLVRELRGDELQNSAKMLSVDAVTSSSLEGKHSERVFRRRHACSMAIPFAVTTRHGWLYL